MGEQFEASFPVRIGDINYGGHMGNDRFLLLFQDARLLFLQSLGCSEADIGGGVGLIMSEARLRFKAEAFYGETLSVRVGITNLRETRFTLVYEVHKVPDGTLVATGSTELVGFDYGARRVRRLPEAFAERARLLAQ
jgi:acyl-CoA thioester hydrolase